MIFAEDAPAFLLVDVDDCVEGGLLQLGLEVVVGDAGGEVVDDAAEVGELLGVGGDLQEVVDLVEDLGVDRQQAVLDEGEHRLRGGSGSGEVLAELVHCGEVVREEMRKICEHIIVAFTGDYVFGICQRHKIGVESVESLDLLGFVEVEGGERLFLPMLHLLDDLHVAVARLRDL